MTDLFPTLTARSDAAALRFGLDASSSASAVLDGTSSPGVALTYAELAAEAGALAHGLRGLQADGPARVAVWATPTMATSVAVVAGLLAGVPVIPVNPKSGERELAHIVADSRPSLVLAGPGDVLPAHLGELPRQDVTVGVVTGGAATGLDVPSRTVDALDEASSPPSLPPEPSQESPAFVVYTSGTTGPPKGVVLPRRAIAATLDAVADAWQWTASDVLVQGLPLFHVHGLILGVLGPLRRGGSLVHLGRFSTDALADALRAGGTMVFGVPTMYHRIADALPADPALAKALRGARLLVSGSAALPVVDHERIAAATGCRVVERYGMTETLMNTSVRAGSAFADRAPGTVGPPLPGVDLRLVDETGEEVHGQTVGEIQVNGPNLFTEYLNRPDATAEAFDGEWFRTGDMAVREPDGYLRIVGRSATDLIKSGGYKIGAGEIENALLEHPGVAEAAVTAEPDPDLGERVVAWVVASQERPSAEELAEHVARLLSPHKRPRVVRYLDELPRNDMGKVLKRSLREGPSARPMM